MPKVSFKIKPVVCVFIKGEEDNSPLKEGEPNLPCCPNDGGLIRRLFKFETDEKIFPIAKMPEAFGGGTYFGFFTAEDAAKIEAWLFRQGAERESQ